jgi:hypothetical protein
VFILVWGKTIIWLSVRRDLLLKYGHDKHHTVNIAYFLLCGATCSIIALGITAVSSRVRQHETSCVREILMDCRKKLKRKNERKIVKEGMQERERK